MRSPILLLSLAIAVSVPALALAGKGYHLWYDESGQAVYSQFAPGEGRPSEIVRPPPPPSETPEAARERLLQQLQRFEDNREDEELAEQETAQAQATASESKQRCEAARKNLELLSGPPRQLFQTADGVRRLSEPEREEKRAEMRKIIAEECN